MSVGARAGFVLTFDGDLKPCEAYACAGAKQSSWEQAVSRDTSICTINDCEYKSVETGVRQLDIEDASLIESVRADVCSMASSCQRWAGNDSGSDSEAESCSSHASSVFSQDSLLETEGHGAKKGDSEETTGKFQPIMRGTALKKCGVRDEWEHVSLEVNSTTGALRITVQGEEEGSIMQLRQSDNGIDIAESQIPDAQPHDLVVSTKKRRIALRFTSEQEFEHWFAALQHAVFNSNTDRQLQDDGVGVGPTPEPDGRDQHASTGTTRVSSTCRRFVVLRDCLAREDMELDSPQLGVLGIGEELFVIAEVMLALGDGSTRRRLCFRTEMGDGWVSECSKSGLLMVRELALPAKMARVERELLEELAPTEPTRKEMIAQAELGLAAGWAVDVSHTTGEVYYVKLSTCESQYERPASLPRKRPSLMTSWSRDRLD